MYLNDAIIKEILQANPNFTDLVYDNNTLTLGNEKISLDNFSLIEIFGPYSELKNDIKKESMTASDLFKIIKLNVTLKNVFNLNDEEKENQLEEIKEKSSNIKKIKIVNKDGIGKYIHFVTDSNIDYILKSRNNDETFNSLMEIITNKGSKLEGLNEKELYLELKRSLDEVPLTNKTNPAHSEMMKEELDRVDKKESNGSMALGNSKENLVVQNHEVTYYSIDKNTNNILEHKTSRNIEDENTKDYEARTDVQEVSKLISIIEFKRILEEDSLTQDDELKLHFFYGFIEELYKYRYYLCDDGLSYLSNYENHILNLMLKDNLNNLEEEAVSKYEILANTKNRSEEINIDYVTKLELDAKKATRAGYASSLLIIEIVIFIAVSLSSFIFLYFYIN